MMRFNFFFQAFTHPLNFGLVHIKKIVQTLETLSLVSSNDK